MIRIFSDRATVVAIAIRQIIEDAALEPDELQRQLEQYPRDEFADIERQIAADRRDCS